MVTVDDEDDYDGRDGGNDDGESQPRRGQAETETHETEDGR